MSRRALPPPPPPAEMRAWPDRDAMLADRARAMGELHRMTMGASLLAQLWAMAAGFTVGWLLFASALREFDEGVDLLSPVFGAVLALLGAAIMVPTGLLIAFGLAHDGKVRALLRAWTALARDPARDARFTSPVLSLAWFLPSFLLCACGLWLSFTVPAGAEPGKDTLPGVVLLMGLGTILWLTGLIGAAKAVGHYRWAVRLPAGGRVPASAAEDALR